MFPWSHERGFDVMGSPVCAQPRLSAISRHLILAGSALFLVTAMPAIAQSASPAAGEAARNFDIPAQPLRDALRELMQQGRLQIGYEAADVEGKTSSAVSGSMSAGEALSRLLAGTGLTFRYLTAGSVALEPAPRPASGAIQLGPVRVEDGGASAGGIAPSVTSDMLATERTGSFTTRGTASATKLPLSLRETPQSVTVITRERIETENLVDLIDVVDSTPGLVVSYNGARPFFQSRGFEIDRITQDGIPTIHDNYIPGSLGNMAMQDRVEVVRGATSLMQGAGNPSAAINLIRKRPTDRFQIDASASAGSWNDYRATGDISGPVTGDGRIRARVVGYYQDAENFRDIEEDDSRLLYATVDFGLTERTILNVGYSYLDIHSNFAWGGIPLAYDGGKLDVPRSTFVGVDWEYLDNKVHTVYAGLDHDFGGGWRLKLNAAYVDARTDTLATAVAPTEPEGGYGHVWWAAEKNLEQKAIDLYVSGPIELFGRTHELVLGGALSREESHVKEWFDIWYPTSSSGVDFLTWNHSAPRPDISDDSPYRYDYDVHSKQDSLYATGRFELADPLKLILGGRLDWYDRTALWGGDGYGVDAHLTKYAGVTYDITRNHTVYASYTDVFQPQSQRGIDGDYLDPVVGQNYEIGLKGEYFDGALNASVALFRLDQTNRARLLDDQSSCPIFPADSCYAATGLVRSKGIDAELQGALTPDWRIAAGFTWSRARIRKDADPANIGKVLNTLIPTTQFKLSTEYRLPGALNRVKLGGRFTWQSRIFAEATAADDTPVRNQQQAYGLLDLFATYTPVDRLSVQLAVNNVFDKTYYRNLAGEWGSFFYSASGIFGEPRNVLATVRYRY